MADWSEVKKEGEVSVWKPEENEELEGILTEIRKDIGPNNSTMFVITTPEDEMVAVWSTAVLDSKLGQLEIGSEVKMKYLGKRKSKTTPGSYHDFAVFTKPKTTAEEVLGV